MGGRRYPSTLEVTQTQPRGEEWPCPGSRRHASWRQRSAQCSPARESRQRHTAKHASTRQHAAHSIAEQSKVVYHNNGGGQPHHPPQAPAPAQHPTPRVGARPITQALHPRKPPPPANKASTQTSKALGARTRPRQWVGGPIQALRRLPELGPNGGGGPARVAAAATPHRGSVAHNAEAA